MSHLPWLAVPRELPRENGENRSNLATLSFFMRRKNRVIPVRKTGEPSPGIGHTLRNQLNAELSLQTAYPHPRRITACFHGVLSRRTFTAWFNALLPLINGVLSQLARRVEHALCVRRDRVCRAAEDLGPVDRVVADGEEGRVLLRAELDGGRRAQVHLGVGLGVGLGLGLGIGVGSRRAQVHLVGAVGKAQPARAREGREERRVLG